MSKRWTCSHPAFFGPKLLYRELRHPLSLLLTPLPQLLRIDLNLFLFSLLSLCRWLVEGAFSFHESWQFWSTCCLFRDKMQHSTYCCRTTCHRLKTKIETMHATMSAKGRPQTISLADVASTDGPRECERACDGYRLAASES
jgi:hypothetical protein